MLSKLVVQRRPGDPLRRRRRLGPPVGGRRTPESEGFAEFFLIKSYFLDRPPDRIIALWMWQKPYLCPGQ